MALLAVASPLAPPLAFTPAAAGVPNADAVVAKVNTYNYACALLELSESEEWRSWPDWELPSDPAARWHWVLPFRWHESCADSQDGEVCTCRRRT